MAMTMFAVVSAPLAGVLLASVAQQKLRTSARSPRRPRRPRSSRSARCRTTRSDVATATRPARSPRRMPATQLGIRASTRRSTTRISFMDDAPATSYRTRADYKRVVVTVVRNADTRRLTQQVTYVAPPGARRVCGPEPGDRDRAGDRLRAEHAARRTRRVTLERGPEPGAQRPHRRGGHRRSSRAAADDGRAEPLRRRRSPRPATRRCAKDDLPPATAARTAIVARPDVPDRPARLQAGDDLSSRRRTRTAPPYTGPATATISSSRGTQSLPVHRRRSSTVHARIAGEPIVPNVQYTVRDPRRRTGRTRCR